MDVTYHVGTTIESTPVLPLWPAVAFLLLTGLGLAVGMRYVLREKATRRQALTGIAFSAAPILLGITVLITGIVILDEDTATSSESSPETAADQPVDSARSSSGGR